MFDPDKLAMRWYFGELAHEDLPQICCDAIENGYDGPMLRRVAGLIRPLSRDVSEREIDGLFREMGIVAPILKQDTQIFLAKETARDSLSGAQNPVDAATHIRIYICEFKPNPPELAQIVKLSKEIKSSPRSEWSRLEEEIRTALAALIAGEK